MREQDLEFHNVDHLERVPGMEGLRLERFPARFKQELGYQGIIMHNFVRNVSTGVRFVL